MFKGDRLEEVTSGQLRAGTSIVDNGVEFALFSKNAEAVRLCLFDDDGKTETARLAMHRHDDHVWRGLLKGAGAGLKYGYRVEGPWAPHEGHWFNPAKLLVDPYARQLDGIVVNDAALFAYKGDWQQRCQRDSAAFVPKAIVTDDMGAYDGTRPGTGLARTVIYELHVAGFSMRHLDVPEKIRGTFESLTSPPLLAHIKRLGITAVQLMPVFVFNDEPHLWAQGLENYWGYNPFGFFAPDPRYGSPGQFVAMVRRFHEAGIEVILDVVFNHTGEGDINGPMLSLRGIDNNSYYRHLPERPGTLANDTGCGNMLDFDRQPVRELVLSSLRYWAGEMGVDGFRFDLAPVLGRSREGFSADAPFFEAVRADPVLSKCKLIAEPWDIGADGYRLGQFPRGWSEWNDRYRDGVRAFWRGDDGTIGRLAALLCGSGELFSGSGRQPQATINFITAHDGFTLQDLVSFEQKHNEANGENNRDGHDHNLSRNYGTEGPTDDEDIIALRNRQKRNMLATLFLSQGIPMLQAGDELGRSQNGNNNSYCQNNDLNWIDWQNADLELSAFVARLVRLRRDYPQLRLHGFLTGTAGLKGEESDIVWLSPRGTRMQTPDWELPFARCFGFLLAGIAKDDQNISPSLLVLMNAHHDVVDFHLPDSGCYRRWRRVLDSTVSEYDGRELVKETAIALPAFSLVVLSAEDTGISDCLPTDLYSLADQCRLAGIAESYEDLSGHSHHLSTDDKRQFLAALGLDASSREATDRQVRRSLKERWQNMLPPVTVLRQDEQGIVADHVMIRLRERDMGRELNWFLRLETGRRVRGQLAPEQLALAGSCRIGADFYHELVIEPLRLLPLGYHHLELAVGTQKAQTRLIIAPPHCYTPDWLQENRRLWGLAHQLYSLGYPDKDIGDFSDLAELAHAAAMNGADVLGVSPLHALFPGDVRRISPYSPSSRLVLNTFYLDISKMDGFEECDDVFAFNGETGEGSGDLVDYGQVARHKCQAFERLFSHFLAHADTGQKREFARFCFERGEPLRSYARFCVLSEKFNDRSMHDWPRQWQRPDSPKVQEFIKRNGMRVYYHSWLQWQADKQLARAEALCERMGMRVGLYGDLAAGVAADGAECWACPEDFLQGLSFGAPPDAFNAAGQNWGMPPFDPRALSRRAYEPFIDILRENMRHCGALRIDHVMWLARMFVIPQGKPASSGTYLHYPLDDLLAVLALESERARCIIVGEDLGTVPAGFRQRMEQERILSYRLIRFEKHHDNVFKAPQQYPFLALATPSSHDLPTLKGFGSGSDLRLLHELGLAAPGEDGLQKSLSERNEEIAGLIAALDEQGLWHRKENGIFTSNDSNDNDKNNGNDRLDELAEAIMLFLARSRAALALFNLEDLAGSFRQVNVPGTVNEVPNWRHRLDFSPSRLLEDEKLVRLLKRITNERKKRNGPVNSVPSEDHELPEDIG